MCASLTSLQVWYGGSISLNVANAVLLPMRDEFNEEEESYAYTYWE